MELINVDSITIPEGTVNEIKIGGASVWKAYKGFTDKVPYNFRQSAGGAVIGNREKDKIVGGTIAWNQRFNALRNDTIVNGITFTHLNDGTVILNGTATQAYFNFNMNRCDAMGLTVNGNKVLLSVEVVKNDDNISFSCFAFNSRVDWRSTVHTESFSDIGKIDASKGEGFGLTSFEVGTVFNDVRIKINVFDLTQMFGSTIADYLYSIDRATAGAGGNWFKNLFPKSYYAHNTGELMSVCTNAHKMGFGQNRFISYPLEPIEFRGIPKLDEHNKMYYDGDTYEHDGTVTRRYGIVDLGTGQYIYYGDSGVFRWIGAPSFNNNLLSVDYTANKESPAWEIMSDRTMQSGLHNLIIKDLRYTDPAAFKSAMSGVYLIYELETPTTGHGLPFSYPQLVDGSGTEEYVDALSNPEVNERDVAIPVGHETFY